MVELSIKSAVEVFHDWTLNGKDEGMEKAHASSVTAMLDFALNGQRGPFSFIDAGCGTGWTVRRVASHRLCHSATGVDGAEGMVEKARSNDTVGKYFLSDLLQWIPEKQVDVVHSMEVFYYLAEPQVLIQHVSDNWLKKGGRLIIGIDFYTENRPSHSWATDCGISVMTMLSEDKWKDAFRESGFIQIKSWCHGAEGDWAGTLIVTGVRA